MTAATLQPLTGRRRVVDKVMRGLMGAAAVVALIPLVLVIYYILKKGLGIVSGVLFTTDPTGATFGTDLSVLGGIKSAIIGTLIMLGLATLISVPIGIAIAVWLVEYRRASKPAAVIRYLIDVMTGVPSVVFGLFIYVTLVETQFGGSGFAAWKGSVAISLLMLPIVARSSEVVLLLVPDGLRESALALGAPRWRVVFRVVLPTAAAGLLTGSLLAIARGAGETAPLLFTAQATLASSTDLSQRMNSLPIAIYNDIQSPNSAIVDRAWGAALTLVALILILTLIARFIASRSRLAT
ncbi:MAG TPA: phosphate ABC transporter permease PstA [Solirubrobacteraceae bacterium]|nr:phosphate ABC transporter permease PstA [Solirubrobacteraceae bacterium]